jgi:flagellar protein FliO/FliZ
VSVLYANKILRIFIIIILIFWIPSPGSAKQGEGIDSVYEGYKGQKNTSNEQVERRNISTSNQTEGIEHKPPFITFLDFLKMIFALLFVLALIYGALKFINSRNKLFDGARSVENIGGTNLGNNKSLQLVKVGNSILVVGVGDSINLLKEITDEEEKDHLLQAYRDRTESNAITSENLSTFVEKLRNVNKNKNTSHFSSLLKEQIGQLSTERKNRMKELDDKEGFKQ